MERFVDWLAGVVVHKEVAGGLGGGAGKAKVVLCGHSMGGLIIGGLGVTLSFLSQRLLDSGCPLGDSTNQGHPRSTTMATDHWTYHLRYSREWRRYLENPTDNNLISVPRFASEYVQK